MWDESGCLCASTGAADGVLVSYTTLVLGAASLAQATRHAALTLFAHSISFHVTGVTASRHETARKELCSLPSKVC